MLVRSLFRAIALALGVAAGGASASVPVTATAEGVGDVVQHGGGCRKDSPPGKCCHAGSQPYHCH